MNESNTVESAPDSLQRTNVKKLIGTRVVVVILMVYLAVMVSVGASGIIGNLVDGFYWRSTGWSLFPIPLNPAWWTGAVIWVLVPFTPLEFLVYLIFVGHGIWVFWEVIGVAYIVYPWSQFVVKRGRSIIAAKIGRSL